MESFNAIIFTIYFLLLIETNLVPYAPMYLDVGRRRTESEYCSNMCAVHPVILLEAKNKVKNSLGMFRTLRTSEA